MPYARIRFTCDLKPKSLMFIIKIIYLGLYIYFIIFLHYVKTIHSW